MPAQSNSRVEQYRNDLQKVDPVHIGSRIFYRDAATTGYSDYHIGVLHGLTNGARYSPPGEYPVLYLAGDPLLCSLEVAHHTNLTASHDAAVLLRQIADKVANLDKIREALNSGDEPLIEHTLGTLAEQYSFLADLYQQDPLSLWTAMRMRTPQAHEALRVKGDSGSRINVPLSVTANVLDLTDDTTLSKLKLSLAEISIPTKQWKDAQESLTWTLCQDLGRAAWLQAYDGILFRTALPEHEMCSLVTIPINLVLFMDEDKPWKCYGSGASYKVSDQFIETCDRVFIKPPR